MSPPSATINPLAPTGFRGKSSLRLSSWRHVSHRARARMHSNRTAHVLLVAALASVPATAQQPVAQVRESGGDLVIEFGPIDLPAHTAHDEPPTLTVRLPSDGWLRGLDVDL